MSSKNTTPSSESAPTIIDMFEKLVATDPEAPAVVHRGVSTSRRELDEKATRLAAYVRRCGVGPEDTVSLHLDRGLYFVVAFYAVLKAEGVAVPVPPEYPEERRRLIDSLATPVLVLDEDQARRFSEDGNTTTWSRISTAESACYNIFTSGSTGVPKGVEVTSTGIKPLVTLRARRHRTRLGSRVLQFSSPGFDAMIWEVVIGLLAGGTLYIPTDTERLPGDLELYLNENAIDDLMLTPSVLAEMSPGSITGRETSLVAAGEAFSPELANEWVGHGRAVFNGYGPTETTVVATVSRARTRPETDTPAIGDPVPGTQLYILDEQLDVVETGDIGELYIAGPGLARGYRAQPGLTAASFVACPFPGASPRMYRTGDLVSARDDGQLAFHGRRDHQIKINGQRVEASEIESALVADEHVTRAAVRLLERPGFGATLVGYICTERGSSIDVDHIRENLATTLPSHMVPATVISVASFPQTANGKIDFAALPTPSWASDSTDEAETVDRERVDASIVDTVIESFRDALGDEDLASDDDFFSAGGHSLLAARVAARLREATGTSLTFRHILELRTAANVSAKIAEENGNGEETPTGVAHSRDEENVGYPRTAPLTAGLRSMWVMYQLGRGGEYHVPVIIEFPGTLDARLFSTALNAVVDRHEALRSCFRQAGPEPEIVVEAPGAKSIDVPLLKVSPSQIDDAVNEAIAAPFDLENNYPVHASIVSTSDKSVAVIVAHHIACDGNSLGTLINDLRDAAASLHDGRAEPALSPAPSYTAHVHAVRRAERAPERRADIEHWKAKLGGTRPQHPFPPEVEAPSDGDEIAVQGVSKAAISCSQLNELRKVAEHAGTSVFSTLVATVRQLAYEVTGQGDVVLGSVVTSPDDDISEMVGYFGNAVGLRTPVKSDDSLQSLAQRCGADIVDAIEHSRAPFDTVATALGHGGAGRNPLFDVAVLLQDEASSAMEIGNLQGTVRFPDPGTAKFDLTFTFSIRPDGGLDLELGYRRGCYSEASARNLADRWASIASRPADEHRTIGSVFAALAASEPTAIAATAGNDQLTYSDLYNASNRISAQLAELGVGHETRVLVALSHGVHWPAVALGVIRAGGAILSIDPKAPHERLQRIVRLSSALLVITDDTSSMLGESLGLKQLTVTPQSALDAARSTIEHSLSGPPDPATPESVAAVFTTSGTTGKPKCVSLTHRGLVDFTAASLWRDWDDARVLCHSALPFDASVIELWVTLLRGSTLVFLPEGIDLDIDALETSIAQDSVDVVWLTAGLLRILGAESPASLRGARVVASGGDVVSAPALQWIREACPGLSAINAYGPSEITVAALGHRMASNTEVPDPVPIGTPLEACTVDLLGAELEPVAAGEVGEIYVAGDGIARGYDGQPGLTASRFVATPWGAPGRRMYRTGDLAVRRTDGTYEFRGRVDDQIKIRGFRVELGEVTSALNAIPGVKDSYATTFTGPSGSKEIIGYAVSRDPGVDPDELKAALAEQLQEFMIPQHLYVVDELPMTPNQKVDKESLPSPYRLRGPRAEGTKSVADATPATEASVTEDTPAPTHEDRLSTVIDAFSSITSSDIGADSDFFTSGGDSILAIQLVRRLKSLGIKCRTKDIFELRTPRGIVSLSAASPEQEQPHNKGGHADPRNDGEPANTSKSDDAVTANEADSDRSLAHAERTETTATPVMNWWAGTGVGHAESFCQSMTIVPPHNLDVDRFGVALQELRGTHEPLRMVIEFVDGDLDLRISGDDTVDIRDSILTVRLDRDAQFDEQIDPHKIAAARRLSPTEGKLINAVVFRDSSDTATHLLLTVHHFAIDAVSWPILIDHLKAAYDYGLSESSDIVPTSWTYWTETLAERATLMQAQQRDAADDPAASLAKQVDGVFDRVLSPSRDVSLNYRSAEALADRELSQGILVDAPQELGVELPTLLLASFLHSLRSSGMAERIDVDVEVHGRDESIAHDIDLSGTIGWFTAIEKVTIPDYLGTGLAPIIRHLASMDAERHRSPLDDGLRRYMHGRHFATHASSAVGFNFLGRVGTSEGSEWSLDGSISQGIASETDPRDSIRHPFEVTVRIVEQDGEDALALNVSWPAGAFDSGRLDVSVVAWLDSLAQVTKLTRDHVRLDIPKSEEIIGLDLSQNEIDAIYADWIS